MLSSKSLSFCSGIICGLSFAPIFFTPGIFTLSILCGQIANASKLKTALTYNFLYFFGFLLATLYWISFALKINITEFWWLIPFALFGIPLFISIFSLIIGLISWNLRHSRYYHLSFCISWIIYELGTNWICTGFPWAIIGYSLTISNILIQFTSIAGIIGLSFITVYISSSFFYIKTQYHNFYIYRIIVSIILILFILSYGWLKLYNYKTDYTNIKIRIVQPSIPQKEKWCPKKFWSNLIYQINLSKKISLIENWSPNIILWSESALIIPNKYKTIISKLSNMLLKDNQILISGSISEDTKNNINNIYPSLIAINNKGNTLLDYHKSHLVPFGEYIPLNNFILKEKITHGFINYSPGIRKTIFLDKYNLHILPVICYESIFSFEILTSNKNIDVIINVTNDSWYGNSSGPYQHFEISRIRAIENGLPILRIANNGISAIIDPLGQVMKKLQLNEPNIIDGYIPKKTKKPTIFSTLRESSIIILITIVLILQELIILLYTSIKD